MANHVKPTKEELEANAMKAAEEAERLAKEHEDKEEDIKHSEEDQEEESSDLEDRREEQILKEEKEEEEEQEDKPDYKKKFIESSREAIVIVSKNKKINEAIDQANNLPDPTEEELQKAYPTYDDMTDTERMLAKDNYINKRRFELIHQANIESKDIEAWNSKVDSFIEDPKVLADNPQLEGKQEDFKIFAMKPSRRGTNFEDLVRSFLYDATKDIPKKGKMFESGTGGDNAKMKPKSDKLTIEQARQLRKTDYGKYKEFLKAGKIESPKL